MRRFNLIAVNNMNLVTTLAIVISLLVSLTCAFATAVDSEFADSQVCVTEHVYVEATGDDGITRTDLVEMCK